jgi:arylsulfatase A-like enzyme
MCPSSGPVRDQLLDAPSNTYSGLRIRNATHDLTYAEFRAGGGPAHPIVPSATNFTELYDNRADEYQLTNLAPTASPALLAALHAELWAVATCVGAQCP